jgi:protocatechuate 3,4-dioxygenase alpha subunit
MLNPSFTRMYFPDEEAANEADLVLRMVPPARRQTLIARLVDGTEPKVYRFDIRFQGEDETVFFDY